MAPVASDNWYFDLQSLGRLYSAEITIAYRDRLAEVVLSATDSDQRGGYNWQKRLGV